MNKTVKKITWSFILILFIVPCILSQELIVLHTVTGPIKTNCYLLYDAKSKEAALIDVGGPIETLLKAIDDNNLKLKYILCTHGHVDHLEGVPVLKKRFPEAQFLLNKKEYEVLFQTVDWMEKNMSPEELFEIKQNPDTAKWSKYDMSIFKPDIFFEENQALKLGNIEIKTILTPGHSMAGICYLAGDMLFSGDTLFYRTTGRIDLLGGSREDLYKSIQTLYKMLPDDTKVYPGHRQFTDIGSEKKENKRVRAESDQK